MVGVNGTGDWMARWCDGVTLEDAPHEGVLLAIGELTLRVEDEQRRRQRVAAWGVTEVRSARG